MMATAALLMAAMLMEVVSTNRTTLNFATMAVFAVRSTNASMETVRDSTPSCAMMETHVPMIHAIPSLDA
jgi:hypothetical protein